MSDGSVTVTVNREGIARLVSGPVYQSMLRLGNRVLTNARGRCPVDTGYLRSTIAMVDLDANSAALSVTAEANYARFVHDGTRYMAARPFLADALTEEMSRL